MRKDFLSFVRRPVDLLRAVRKITVGGVIAATGVTAPTGIAASEAPRVPAVDGTVPTIVDRSRKAAKLVLRLPSGFGYLGAEHRSHRSHSSHSSHYSSSGGGGAVSRPAPPPPPPPAAPPPTSSVPATTLGLVGSAAVNVMRGEIVVIDTDARTIQVRETASQRATFAYRDDSKFETVTGVTIRFDDFADANRQALPVAARERVEITWRMSPDAKTRIVTNIKKVP